MAFVFVNTSDLLICKVVYVLQTQACTADVHRVAVDNRISRALLGTK